jgi:hypothetical protein
MCVYRTFSELGLLIFIGMNTLIIWCSYSIQYVGRKRFFFHFLATYFVFVWQSEEKRTVAGWMRFDKFHQRMQIWPGVCRCLFWYSTYFGYLVMYLFHRIVEEILSLSLVNKSICVGGGGGQNGHFDSESILILAVVKFTITHRLSHF